MTNSRMGSPLAVDHREESHETRPVCAMPFVVLLDGARARVERFSERKIACPVITGMPGEHDRHARKKFRVAEMPPESGIRRDVSAELDKRLFGIPVRGHRLESR